VIKDIDQVILALYYDEGLSIRKIKDIVKVGHQRIRKVIEANLEGIDLVHHIGRPTKITDEIKYLIELETLKNPSISAQKLGIEVSKAFGVELSARTINNTRNQMKFNWRPPKVKQSLNNSQKNMRYQFCSDLYYTGLINQVIYFSDESRFEQQSDSSWRWIRRGEYNEGIFNEKSKSSTSVMVWGCIGNNYKSPLIMISSKIDSYVNSDVIKNCGLVQNANHMNGQYGWYFLHDGATCHQSKKTIDELSKIMNIIPNWPQIVQI